MGKKVGILRRWELPCLLITCRTWPLPRPGPQRRLYGQRGIAGSFERRASVAGPLRGPAGPCRHRAPQPPHSATPPRQVGTPRYWAPEVLATLSGVAGPAGEAAVYDERCDVYSAGLVLWFLLTGCRPVANVLLNPRARPDTEPPYRRWPAAAALAERMWAHDPAARPSAGEALDCLASMRAGGGVGGCGGPGGCGLA